jgi:hypothetical protein
MLHRCCGNSSSERGAPCAARYAGEQPARNEAVLGRAADAESQVGSVLHPVADAVVEVHVGLHIGMLAAELVDDRPDHRQEGRPRGHDAQRSGNLILRRTHALHRTLQRRQRRLRGLEELLAFVGERDVAGGAMQ